MEDFSLEKAINIGTWFEGSGDMFGEQITYRIKITSFEPISQKLLNMAGIHLTDSTMWLMGAEISNRCRSPRMGHEFCMLFCLQDHEGFSFDDYDQPETLQADTGLMLLQNEKIAPKIKARGFIPFVLPNEPATYSLAAGENATLVKIPDIA